jgi:transposase-like protein
MVLTVLRCPNCHSENLKPHTTYTVADGSIRQIHRCQECGNSFSDTKNTPLEGLKTPLSVIIPILDALNEGLGVNAACRSFHTTRKTLKRWLKRLGSLKETLLLYALCHQFIQLLIEGDSLKIEGRTKSHYYAARTAQVYRQAIDDTAAGKPFDNKLMAELNKLANRGYTEGFYRRHQPSEYQNYQNDHIGGSNNTQQFVGEVLGHDDKTGLLEIAVKNHFELGDNLELMRPQGGNLQFPLEHLENQQGENITVAPGSGHTVRVRAPVPDEVTYGLLLKEL